MVTRTRLARMRPILRPPAPIAARASGLPSTSAAGPVTRSTAPPTSRASTTQDIPVAAG